MAVAKKKNNNRRKAGIKALRQTARKTVMNNDKKRAIDMHERLFTKAVAAKNMESAVKEMNMLQSLYGKAAKVGIYHKNAAARYTSSMTRTVATIK